MQNIEYLSERDLKYFEKKEALGEAIIIRIEPWRVSYRETNQRPDRRRLPDRRKDKILPE